MYTRPVYTRPVCIRIKCLFRCCALVYTAITSQPRAESGDPDEAASHKASESISDLYADIPNSASQSAIHSKPSASCVGTARSHHTHHTHGSCPHCGHNLPPSSRQLTLRLGRAVVVLGLLVLLGQALTGRMRRKHKGGRREGTVEAVRVPNVLEGSEESSVLVWPPSAREARK
jgi:hypothetical protein